GELARSAGSLLVVSGVGANILARLSGQCFPSADRSFEYPDVQGVRCERSAPPASATTYAELGILFQAATARHQQLGVFLPSRGDVLPRSRLDKSLDTAVRPL